MRLVEASPEGHRETRRFTQPARSGEQAGAYPALSAGRLYLRDMDVLLCYDVREGGGK